MAFLWVIDSSSLIAQSDIVGPPGSSLNQTTTSSKDERVLVLRTGRVMKGRIKTISTGWLVSTDRGNAVIPFQQVHFDADDLNEAYLRLRIQNGRPTVASHLRLAEWCLSQNILAEAARELRDALEKDPGNETARLMLDRVDTEIRRRTPEPVPEQPVNDVVLIPERDEEPQTEEVRSLSGLSPDTAREFVASIQPLLLNKCGNARCHGSAASNDFQLTRLRGGASHSRVVSEKNLASVLRYIDPDQGGTASLLRIVRGSHAGQTVFHGRYGAVQMQTFQQWIKLAARELHLEAAPVEPTTFATARGEPFSSVETPVVSDIAAETSGTYAADSPTPLSPVPAGVSGSATDRSNTDSNTGRSIPQSVDSRPLSTRVPSSRIDEPAGSATGSTPLTNVQKLLHQAREHVRRKDAFDPEEFNRRFAGSRSQ